VIAAEITSDSPDFGHLQPMITATQRELVDAGICDPLEVVVADTGYWHQVQMDELALDDIIALIPPDAGKRKGSRPGWDGGRYAFMRRVLATDIGAALYAKADRTRLRQHEVQPPHRPLRTPRTISLPLGMATDQRHPQHAQSSTNIISRSQPPERAHVAAEPVAASASSTNTDTGNLSRAGFDGDRFSWFPLLIESGSDHTYCSSSGSRTHGCLVIVRR
jgi:hypothetical protein